MRLGTVSCWDKTTPGDYYSVVLLRPCVRATSVTWPVPQDPFRMDGGARFLQFRPPTQLGPCERDVLDNSDELLNCFTEWSRRRSSMFQSTLSGRPKTWGSGPGEKWYVPIREFKQKGAGGDVGITGDQGRPRVGVLEENSVAVREETRRQEFWHKKGSGWGRTLKIKEVEQRGIVDPLDFF